MPRPRTVADEQILDAAARVISEMGPARMTLSDVGVKVGLAPATLSQRFGSKRGLLLALAAHDAGAVPDRIRAAADASDPLGALVSELAKYAGNIQSPSEYAHHLSFLLMDLEDPDFVAISRRQSAAFRAAIRDVLSSAHRQGMLNPDVDPAKLGELLYAVYNGTLVSWGLSPKGRPRSAVAAALRLLLSMATPKT